MNGPDMSSLHGTGVALVTPFNREGEIDYQALKRLVDHVTDGGVDYLVALGTTGEAPTLNKEERKRVFEFVLETNNNRLPVVAGVGGNCTREVLDTFRDFNFFGFTAILSVSPYYNKPNQEGIYQHYKVLAENAPLPIILYNVPARTGSNMHAHTTLRLAGLPGIVGIKEASGNFDQFSAIVKNKPAEFLLISGDDAIAVPMVSLGAKGLISVAANAFPSQVSAMVKKALDNAYERGMQEHQDLYAVMDLIFRDGSPSGIKTALSAMGICEDTVRLPLWPVGREVRDGIIDYLRKNNFLRN